jgi:hypothetical protein
MTITAAALAAFSAGCSRGPSEAESAKRGRELIHQMSNTLAASKSLSFSTQEHREVLGKDGQKRAVRRARNITLRRPDRFYSNQTGETPTETWYDGKYVTLAVHSHEVYGQIKSPNTVDATLDAMANRFGLILPVGDLLYSRPEDLLVSSDLKGGYVDVQNLNGVECHHLSFTMPGVDWELWLPTKGEALPHRLKVKDKKHKGEPVTDIVFSTWNLQAQPQDEMFKPKVPASYEGIAVLQRAAALPKTASTGSDAETRARTAAAPAGRKQ